MHFAIKIFQNKKKLNMFNVKINKCKKPACYRKQ